MWLRQFRLASGPSHIIIELTAASRLFLMRIGEIGTHSDLRIVRGNDPDKPQPTDRNLTRGRTGQPQFCVPVCAVDRLIVRFISVAADRHASIIWVRAALGWELHYA